MCAISQREKYQRLSFFTGKLEPAITNSIIRTQDRVGESRMLSLRSIKSKVSRGERKRKKENKKIRKKKPTALDCQHNDNK